MRENRISDRITEVVKKSRSPLLKKLGKSLDRDQEFSLSFRALKALIYLKSMAVAPYALRKCNSVGARPRTRKMPNIENDGQIIIGDDVNINSRNVQTDLVTGPSGKIEIGDEVTLNFGVSVVAYNQVTLGNRVRVGPYSMIYDSDFHKLNDRYAWAEGEPVILEDDVWLATRVIVLKGSLIGRGSVIAAGSVVSGFIPPYVVAGGVPAKVIKYLTPPDDCADLLWSRDIPDQSDSTTVSDQIRSIIRERFPDMAVNGQGHFIMPDPNTEPASIARMKLIRALEREFEIRIGKKEWARMSNFGKICKIVQEKLNRKTAGSSDNPATTTIIKKEESVNHS